MPFAPNLFITLKDTLLPVDTPVSVGCDGWTKGLCVVATRRGIAFGGISRTTSRINALFLTNDVTVVTRTATKTHMTPRILTPCDSISHSRSIEIM